MRCINFDLKTGLIEGFTLPSYPLQSNQVLIDLELYEELLKTRYKMKSPKKVANRLHTKVDLASVFEVVTNSNNNIGSDSATLVIGQIQDEIEDIKMDLSHRSTDIIFNQTRLDTQDKINDTQTTDIMVTQDAVDFLLFQTLSGIMEVSGNSRTTRNGGDIMSAYFVSRIIKKGAISLEQGRSYYLQVKTQYPHLIEEIDFLLISEGKEELIVK